MTQVKVVIVTLAMLSLFAGVAFSLGYLLEAIAEHYEPHITFFWLGSLAFSGLNLTAMLLVITEHQP